jgi:hypothetical protein
MVSRTAIGAVPYAFMAGTVPDTSITGSKLGKESVGKEKIKKYDIDSTLIAEKTIGKDKIRLKDIDSTLIADSTIGKDKIRRKDIDSTLIADKTIGKDKIRPKDIDSTLIADQTIGTDKIADGSILFADIAPNGTPVAGQIMKWSDAPPGWVLGYDVGAPSGGDGWVHVGKYVILSNPTTDSVGIGVSTPSEKLDVDGSILVRDKANIGNQNVNTGSYAFVAGSNNRARGAYSVVSGGGGATLADSNSAIGDYSTVGGGTRNKATQSYSTVGGGAGNIASQMYATVGGGSSNAATTYATVSGGVGNTASQIYATVGGGVNNIASSNYATVGGGNENTASQTDATVSGGWWNRASGVFATVPGGGDNRASGQLSFAAGWKAEASHAGAFVWADQTGYPSGTYFTSERTNQFRARANGGVRFDINNSGWVNIYDDGTNLITTSSGASLTTGGEWDHARRADTALSVVSNSVDSANIIDGTIQLVDLWQNGASSGQVIKWDGSAWSPASDEGGGGAYLPLAGGTMTGVISSTGDPDITMGKGNFGSGNINTGTQAFVAGSNNRARGAYSVVSGGGSATLADSNSAIGDYSTVAGGRQNRSTSDYATVGGGVSNTASGGYYPTIAGGVSNTASAQYAAVGGGIDNTASQTSATVSGGSYNTASGAFSTVPGGSDNRASGQLSFAAGWKAEASHAGAFVWADQTGYPSGTYFTSERTNQFRARANGGARFDVNNSRWVNIYDNGTNLINTSSGATLTTGGTWTNSSDRNLKEHFTSIDGKLLLEKLSKLPISLWNYRSERQDIKHIGPMAQDFYALFGVGNDDKTISTVDPAGIALAAIQELLKQSEQKTARIEQLEAQMAEMKMLVNKLLEGRNGAEGKK